MGFGFVAQGHTWRTNQRHPECCWEDRPQAAAVRSELFAPLDLLADCLPKINRLRRHCLKNVFRIDSLDFNGPGKNIPVVELSDNVGGFRRIALFPGKEKSNFAHRPVHWILFSDAHWNLPVLSIIFQANAVASGVICSQRFRPSDLGNCNHSKPFAQPPIRRL